MRSRDKNKNRSLFLTYTQTTWLNYLEIGGPTFAANTSLLCFAFQQITFEASF